MVASVRMGLLNEFPLSVFTLELKSMQVGDPQGEMNLVNAWLLEV